MDVAQNNRKQIHQVRAEICSRVFIGLLSRIPSGGIAASLLPIISSSPLALDSPVHDAHVPETRGSVVLACSSVLRENNVTASGALHTAHRGARPKLPAPDPHRSRVRLEAPTRLHETAEESSISQQ